MNKMFPKRQVIGVGLAAGISCLVASPAQAALFNFSYTFTGVNPGTVFQGMVEGTPDGDNLLNPTITMFEVLQNDVVVATLNDADFTDKDFTFSGTNVLILTDGAVDPGVTLDDGNVAAYTPFFASGTVVNENAPDVTSGVNWSLTAKSVPEGNMSVVSWLALAGIGGLSVKYGKRKSL